MKKNISPEKLHALGVLCALAAIFILVVLLSGNLPPSPRSGPADLEQAKPWVLELP